MRKAIQAGETMGAGGQWCHHPRGAIANDSITAVGHNPGLAATTIAAWSHQVAVSPEAPSGLELPNGREGVSCGCQSATLGVGASRRARQSCRHAGRNP
jgi:hypothetical protein